MKVYVNCHEVEPRFFPIIAEKFKELGIPLIHTEPLLSGVFSPGADLLNTRLLWQLGIDSEARDADGILNLHFESALPTYETRDGKVSDKHGATLGSYTIMELFSPDQPEDIKVINLDSKIFE